MHEVSKKDWIEELDRMDRSLFVDNTIPRTGHGRWVLEPSRLQEQGIVAEPTVLSKSFREQSDHVLSVMNHKQTSGVAHFKTLVFLGFLGGGFPLISAKTRDSLCPRCKSQIVRLRSHEARSLRPAQRRDENRGAVWLTESVGVLHGDVFLKVAAWEGEYSNEVGNSIVGFPVCSPPHRKRGCFLMWEV